MSKELVAGSLGAMARQNNQGLAESFLSADVICIVDVSGSMDAHDSRNGRRRYDVANEELTKLQRDLPGKIAVIAFSDAPIFCAGGVPIFQGGGTDLAKALNFVKVADGTVKFIVISDGVPNSREQALTVARTFTSQIDCVFVGNESDNEAIQFLKYLASCTGGRYVLAANARALAVRVQQLMLTAGK